MIRIRQLCEPPVVAQKYLLASCAFRHEPPVGAAFRVGIGAGLDGLPIQRELVDLELRGQCQIDVTTSRGGDRILGLQFARMRDRG